MIVRSRAMMGAVVAMVIFAGLGLGAILALLVRGARTQTTATTIASTVYTPVPAATHAMRLVTTAAPVAPTTAPTAAPTAQPIAPATIPPTAAPSATAAGIANASVHQGAWSVVEANLQDGTMIWQGSAAGSGTQVQFTLHKASIAGHAATPCERATTLQFAVTAGRAAQSTPYREVNCAGVTSVGQVRIDEVSGTSMRGAFWDGSTKLGDFSASLQ